MGSTNLSTKIKAENSKELQSKFKSMCDNSRDEDGSQYSGCWGMKHNVKIVTSKHTDEGDIEDELLERCDKYGDALAVAIPGGYLVVAWASC